jgi:hypothetical protein
MITKTLFRSAAVLAFAASAQLSAAQAKQCLNEGDVRGLVAYALPSVAETVIERCASRLPANAYLNTRGPRLVSDLRSGQSAAWPAAREAMIKISGDAENAEMFRAMPEAMVGPMMEGMIADKFSNELKPESCKDINRVLTTMTPMPAANIVDMLTAVVMIGGRKDKKLQTCAA